MVSRDPAFPLTEVGVAHPERFGWLAIVRLGLVQAALGAIVVLTTSTMNRVMVVELALPALLPGLLVGLYHVLQLVRPGFGHGADIGSRSTPWIVGGMSVLALGAIGAALAIALMERDRSAGVVLAVAAFLAIGLGVGAASTTMLALLAKRVDASRRAAAASIVWVMMIFGFIVTAAVAGRFLDPYSTGRLVGVTTAVSLAALVLALLAIRDLEGAALPATSTPSPDGSASRAGFGAALREVWNDDESRHFSIFVFVSMLAYSAQDLVLEPFAGLAFGYTPGESTRLSGVQNSGVLLGMVLVAILSSGVAGIRIGSLRNWTIAGCLGSALALFSLVFAGLSAPHWPLRASVFVLGLMNGAFAVAAIGSMMAMAGSGRGAREGVRMGVWGAAQAIAFALGGVLATGAVDLVQGALGSPIYAYTSVFAVEALAFLLAASLASGVARRSRFEVPSPVSANGSGYPATVGID
jgi:BCD family chlorophyll transporter-like MFS transporter